MSTSLAHVLYHINRYTLTFPMSALYFYLPLYPGTSRAMSRSSRNVSYSTRERQVYDNLPYNLSTKLGACDPWESVIDDANNTTPLLFAQLTTLYRKMPPSICFIFYLFLIPDMSLSLATGTPKSQIPIGLTDLVVGRRKTIQLLYLPTFVIQRHGKRLQQKDSCGHKRATVQQREAL